MLSFLVGKDMMKKRLHLYLFYLILLAYSVTACNQFPNPDILPEKGGLSIIMIYHPVSMMENPEFFSHEHDVYVIIHLNIDSFNDMYPSLKIDSAPYYIFLDSKGIAFETSDIEAAEDFYINNVNKRKN